MLEMTLTQPVLRQLLGPLLYWTTFMAARLGDSCGWVEVA